MVSPRYASPAEGEVMRVDIGFSSWQWLNLLPGILLISLVILFLWFVSDATIVGSGGSTEETALRAAPGLVTVERIRGQ